MKKLQKILLPVYVLAFILGLLQVTPVKGSALSAQQPNQPEEIASYEIEVQFDPGEKTLTGRETIRYRNTQPEAIPDLVFHLYLNAFRNTESLFLSETGPAHRNFLYDPNQPGWIEVNALRLMDGTALQLELLEDGTLGRADLPAPVASGETIELEVEFTARLPKVFARTGYAGDFVMVGQWFPKLGVWQSGAWNAYSFHGNSEFYADFGNYEVAITLPDSYVTGGVGLPTGSQNNGDGTQTVQYRAEGVIDFAWTASPRFEPVRREVDGIEVVYLVLPEHQWTVERVLNTAEAALRSFGEWFGPYPYPRLTLVDTPDEGAGAGGMEYPTLVTVGANSLTGLNLGPWSRSFERSVELVTAHEIGHQWFQSMVATNEAEEPWLDEGFTDYATVRLMNRLFDPDQSAIDAGNFELGYLDLRRSEYFVNPATPMFGKAWDFTPLNYGVATYSKPALSLSSLERVLGEATMLQLMQTYFQRYQFRHPTTDDFRQVALEVTGQDLEWFFDGLVYGADTLNYQMVSIEEHSFTVVRQGELIIPTEILVTFEDGTTTLETWDGQDEQRTFDYPDRAALRSAEVDPERKILVDLRWVDNGMRRTANVNAWAALFGRLVFVMQDWLLTWGGL